MYYHGWTSIDQCISFSAWLYWEVNNYQYNFIRICGFEFGSIRY